MISTKCNGKINEGAVNSDWERTGAWWILAECDGVRKEVPPQKKSPQLARHRRGKGWDFPGGWNKMAWL